MATINWNGQANDGNFENVDNWDGSELPTYSNDVNIEVHGDSSDPNFGTLYCHNLFVDDQASSGLNGVAIFASGDISLNNFWGFGFCNIVSAGVCDIVNGYPDPNIHQSNITATSMDWASYTDAVYIYGSVLNVANLQLAGSSVIDDGSVLNLTGYNNVGDYTTFADSASQITVTNNSNLSAYGLRFTPNMDGPASWSIETGSEIDLYSPSDVQLITYGGGYLSLVANYGDDGCQIYNSTFNTPVTTIQNMELAGNPTTQKNIFNNYVSLNDGTLVNNATFNDRTDFANNGTITIDFSQTVFNGPVKMPNNSAYFTLGGGKVPIQGGLGIGI